MVTSIKEEEEEEEEKLQMEATLAKELTRR
jgi:hypothetical protein